MSMVLGVAIGPFLGLLLMQQYSIEVIFGLNLVLSFISLILAIFMKVPFETIARTAEDKGFKVSDFIAKEAIPIAIIVFIAGLSYSSILNYIKVFAQERDLITASSYFFVVYAIVSIFSRPVCGRLMDAKNENIVIYTSIIFQAICFLVTAFSHSAWMLLIGGALLGLGYGNITSTSQSVSVEVVPKEKIARATSTFFIGLDLGLGFGPYILGLFTNQIGLGNMYIVMAVLLIVTFFIYHFIHGRKRVCQKHNHAPREILNPFSRI
ncbi:MFS family permease [Staphylococcus saprophyticus]|nr:putative truncated permease of the major facilitator superfamily [Staphylococcus saprophyticus subsp. saprophyticus ATCC 15305] [Staphylococcus saprophyticus subsp. saprophyticus ATCC 15305 = NCTC 7292]SUM64507.1 major facilitator superfamily permease [Staphylococcus saprophyticus]SUM83704.1 major facilitator superfamily permease [Staphylococcus saprophyticus]